MIVILVYWGLFFKLTRGSLLIYYKHMKIADEGNWDLAVHDCSNYTKFARDLNLSSKEGKWFGSSSYDCEFSRIPYEAFLPILRDENFKFLIEEEFPDGYKPGELIF